ncbi:branched-chain amino acid ABC transporter permease [Mycobacterium sp. ITM-2016-00317]|uniref:branched-chain amino acid ABC transporter permease n=1 Tax=Mycobacterium sp. ITM-2016-00317 TaxID=2099694 RepID=UPI00287FE91A|nr:branched-chain amino acid ABC transporter permease [Mycobacterium sp. ITM-2016-00317]WNG86575.1 branched-chain amino acid ABC transporter permease [Mycobacterium sp. ITM-2016-00317]
MNLLVSATVFGVVIAAVLALAAVGFTLQYSVSNVFNLAFSETMVISGFAALGAANAGLPMAGAALVGVAAGVVVSLLLNHFVYQPFARRGVSVFQMLVISLAVSLVLANTLLALVGPLSFRYDVTPTVVFTIASAAVTDLQLVVIGLAVAAMAGMHLLLKRSRLGLAMRAASVDGGLAQSCGIATQRVVATAWAISGGLCGLAGVALFIISSSFSATSGRTFIVLVIAAAVLGGIGDAYGAMLGALVLGLATEVTAVWLDPSFKIAIALLVLIGVLMARPQGIRAEFSSGRALQV